ncbi:MAG: hypothetical protein A2176_11765 [Spirochaetes bacterium RBG_13_51_14]|nr:MAG: hypothetical protein A2176_11765 [Spirochaetes bacterium RBG_13_51_14]
MMIAEDISFYNNLNQRLAGRMYRTGTGGAAGVIYSHGLFSNKDGYKITKLAYDITATGHALMSFDFSCAGESGGTISDISLLQEVEDLAAAVSFFRGRGMNKIHLMGSSMGAAATLLYASQGDPSVASLILIATPVDLRMLLKYGFGIDDAGSLPERGMSVIDGVLINNSFFRELYRIDMQDAVKKIRVPVLAIHGSMDAAVDISNVSLLEKNLSPRLAKMIIPDGDHNLTRDSDIALMKDAIRLWLAGGRPAIGGRNTAGRP